MEQERVVRSGAGYRLAAQAIRARQRATGGQAALDFGEPAWDGPTPEISPDDRMTYWPRSTAALAQLPWRDALAVVRRFSLVGLMGAAGFGLVLYGSRPHPAVKAPNPPPAAVQASATMAPPAPAITPLPAEPAAPAKTAATSAGWGMDNPAPPVRAPAPDLAPQPAAAQAAAPAPSPAEPARRAAPAAAPGTRVATAVPRPKGHLPPLAGHARPPRAAHTLAANPRIELARALPGWLTGARPLVMSAPPHDLTPPPGLAPSRIASLRLPALRPAMARYAPGPATPYHPPAGSAPASALYYGSGSVPPPMPDAN